MGGEVAGTPRHGLTPLNLGTSQTSSANRSTKGSNRTLVIQAIAVTILTGLATAFILHSLFVAKPVALALSLSAAITMGYLYYSANNVPVIPNKPRIGNSKAKNNHPTKTNPKESDNNSTGKGEPLPYKEGEPGLKDTPTSSSGYEGQFESTSDKEEEGLNTNTAPMDTSYILVYDSDPEEQIEGNQATTTGSPDRPSATTPQPSAPTASNTQTLPSSINVSINRTTVIQTEYRPPTQTRIVTTQSAPPIVQAVADLGSIWLNTSGNRIRRGGSTAVGRGGSTAGGRGGSTAVGRGGGYAGGSTAVGRGGSTAGGRGGGYAGGSTAGGRGGSTAGGRGGGYAGGSTAGGRGGGYAGGSTAVGRGGSTAGGRGGGYAGGSTAGGRGGSTAGGRGGSTAGGRGGSTAGGRGGRIS
jgi:hypothetical protein